jgi:L-fuculose-phosphate aldolase
MSANLRQALIDAALAMNAAGINQGRSGNLSVRFEDGFLITPSGMRYENMTAGDIVFMRLDGSFEGSNKPSSEWQIHCDILAARADTGAVLHAHPPYATSLACLGMEIPPFHYMIAVAGGDSIRCAPYATFGTRALSGHVLSALRDRKACLMANHGMVGLGEDLSEALDIAVEVETLCAQYWRALQIGPPQLLTESEMAKVLGKFKAYGRPA